MSTVSALPALGEIDQITREIHTLEAHATERASSAIEFKIEIGKRLTRAKEIMKHGEFLPWAQREFGWGRVHVANHMRLSANVQRVVHLGPEASLRAALAAISAEADAGATDEEPSRVQSAAPAYDVMVPTATGVERLPVSRAFAEVFMRWVGTEPIQIVERA